MRRRKKSGQKAQPVRHAQPDAPASDHRTYEEAAKRAAEEELASRLDAVTSRFTQPPSADELREAFRRKPAQDDDEEPGDDFSSTFTAESLFVPTTEDPEEDHVSGEDRSRTTGDYFYDPENAWGVLGLEPGSAWQQISAAHRRLALLHHPDRMVDASDEDRLASETKIREINVAYSVLRRLTGN